MKKMIDSDRLAKLASELDKRMKTKVQSEQERALIAEDAIQQNVNAVEEMLGGKSLRYITQEEYDVLSEDEKNDPNIVWNITDAPEIYQTLEDGNLNTEDKTIVGAINEVNELIPCRDTRKTTTVEFTFNGTIGNKEVNYEINDGTTIKGHVKVSDINFEQVISGNAMFRIGISMSGMNIGGGDGVSDFEKLQDNLYVTDVTNAYIIIALDNVTTNINSVSRTFTKGIWVYYNLKSGMTTTITSAKLNIVVSGEIQGIDEKYLTNKPGLNVEDKEFNADHTGCFGDEIFNDLDENIASGGYAHAEGWKTQAINQASHAEGKLTIASGPWSHAEGWETQASKTASHAEGSETQANGSHSHAEGKATIASGENQHVQGKYNIEDTENKYAHIVGNGENPLAEYRSNAHTLDWNGNGWFAGNVSIGADNKQLATEEFVTNAINNIEIPAGFSGDYNDLTNKPEIPSVQGLASEDFVNDIIVDLREEMVVLEEDDLTMNGLVDNTFPSLTTENKTLLGAINEINENIQNIEPIEEIEKAVIDEMLMDVFGITVEDGE